MPATRPPPPAAAPCDGPFDRALVWLRRDLRVEDHAALHRALTRSRRVWCAFVFDRDILDPLLAQGRRADRRVEFIRESLVQVDEALRALGRRHRQAGVGLIVRHGDAPDEIERLARTLRVQAVFASHDDDPAALARDARAGRSLAAAGIALDLSKDHVVLERSEVLTTGGTPFSVFTPYRNAWLRTLTARHLAPHEVAPHAHALAPLPPGEAGGVPDLASLGFERTNLADWKMPAGPSGGEALFAEFLERIDRYHLARDQPALRGPSYLSTHLRFGTVSIRRLVSAARERAEAGERGAEVWLSELIWREFYHQILHHHPHVVGGAFKPAYDRIRWATGPQADAWFAAWCEGRTGYPLVDAAMHQINASGYMHNRLRMVVASFLTKDLGLDWRRGEAYFALHLNDFDLAANNGGWQWAASTGCDAQPWFRIFNPVTQSRRFDPEGRFIRRYLPGLARLPDRLIHAPWEARESDLAAAGLRLGADYPRPIVDHALAREQTLQRYAVVKAEG